VSGISRKDDLGRAVTLKGPARRIVSLVPSITETLFALGAGDSVVGLTEYCIHPAGGVADKARVGGTKNIDMNRILELKPDLIIANVEENRKPQVEALERSRLKVFVTYPKSIEGCIKMIADVAALCGADDRAGKLLDSIRTEARQARERAVRPAPGVVCPIWKSPYMTVNRDTFVDSVIVGAGGRNLFGDHADRYPTFELQELKALRPEIILLPTEPYRFTEPDLDDFISLGNDIPAVRHRRLHIVQGELLSWYGPRLARALREISALIRPSAPG